MISVFTWLGTSNFNQQTHYMKIHSKVQSLEEKAKEAERIAELAEADAREKDKDLAEALKKLKDYESVSTFTLSAKELEISLTRALLCDWYCVPYRKHSIALLLLNYSNSWSFVL